MSNHFQGSTEHPYHISVGGVLQNEKGEIAVHYFKHVSHPEFGEADDFYTLMRETLEEHETLEEALSRGLLEEFGATGNLSSYLGSLVSHFPKHGVSIEKTTLYFLLTCTSIDEKKRLKDDPEIQSEIRWVPPSELIHVMKSQGARIGREDLDESAVIERVR